MKAMLITVGTAIGKQGTDEYEQAKIGLAKALVNKSIKRESPQVIFFVVSEQSKEEVLPHILNELEEEPKFLGDNEVKFLNNYSDIEENCLNCLQLIDELIKEGYSNKEIVIDYTSGTKAMSAGLCLAAFIRGIPTFNYVCGQREGGTVISGRERLSSLTPTLLFAQETLKQAIDYFNKYQFQASLDILADLKKTLNKPKTAFLENLVKFYSAWDKFDFAEATALKREIAKSSFLDELKIKDVFDDNCVIIQKGLETANDQLPYSSLKKEVIADLWQNAQRRKQEGKYDDAMARLYRLLEYTAQHNLWIKYKLRTDKANFQQDIDKIKDKLGIAYESWKKRESIALRSAYELLRDLGEEAGRMFCDDDKIRTVLEQRNYSILAHGFKSIKGESLAKAFELARKYITCVIKEEEFRELERKASFPKL